MKTFAVFVLCTAMLARAEQPTNTEGLIVSADSRSVQIGRTTTVNGSAYGGYYNGNATTYNRYVGIQDFGIIHAGQVYWLHQVERYRW